MFYGSSQFLEFGLKVLDIVLCLQRGIGRRRGCGQDHVEGVVTGRDHKDMISLYIAPSHDL